MTHFIPFETERNGRTRIAACGRWVDKSDHSATPSCADCQPLVAQKDAEDAALEARALELGLTVEEVMFGANGRPDPRDEGYEPDCPRIPR